MKKFYWLFTLLIISTQFFAQPANDDCVGIIDLGAAPICPAPGIYNNVDATESDIGNDNFPTCFVGLPERDVWFSFVAVAGFEDLVIDLNGTSDGMGNAEITNPQIAVYRGDCEFDGMVLLDCVSAANGDNNVSIPLDGLTPGITYFLRINDWSATAASNAGAFELCIKVPPPIFTMGDGSSSECSGTVYDSGGPDDDYQNNENLTFTICPDQPNGCINLTLTEYAMEDNFDDLFFYDGPDTNSPQIGSITGIGSTQNDVQGVCYQVSASSGCLTIEIDSDGLITAPGFEAIWECTTEDCPTPTPLEVTSNADFAALEAAFFSPIMDITITDVTCPEDAYGTFLATDDTGLGLDQGILMTTGIAAEAANPATFFANNDLGAPGDPELDLLSGTGPGQNTADVCVVEMDIFAKSNKIQFDYIFGSEEYKQNFSGFSDDLIAILASGNGIPGDPGLNMQENLAILPTNGDIVSVQTVNGGNNWEYYRDNLNSQTITYNGLSVDFMGAKKYLTAVREVAPCDTYHVKLMIGDTDENDDSGLFITPSKEGVPEIAINFQTGIDYLVEGCTNIQDLLEFTLSTPSDFPLTFELEIAGTATLGEDYLLTLPNEITFAAGETKLAFPISAIADIIPEGTETIELSLISDFGCGAVILANFSVDIQEELTVDIESGADTVFVCNDINMTELTVTGGAAYQWEPSGLFNNATSANPTVTIVTSQTVSVTGSLGTCSTTDEIYLQLVAPEVNIDLQGNMQICQGESVTLIANNNVNNAGLTWNPTGTLSNPESETTLATPAFTTTYTATVEATVGCIAMDEITITVEPFITPQLTTTDTTICQNSSVQLASPTLGSSTNYVWSPTDGLNDPNISNAIATPSETTTYTLTSTSINGFCEETAEVTITVLPANVEIGVDTIEICLGDFATFSANTTTGGVGLTWSPSDSLSSTTDVNVSANPSISTWYVATLEIGSCLVQDSVYIRVDSIPNTMIVTVPERDMYCEGETISLISPTYLNLAYPDVTHFWTPMTGALSADTLFNLVVSGVETTTYTRILQNNACADTSSIEIIVVPTPEISITPENPVICAGESVVLTASSDDITEFEWSPNVNLSCTECAETTASPPQTLNYSVTGEFMGCPANANVTVVIAPSPQISLTGQTVICEGGEVDELNNAPAEANTTYLWEVNGMFFSDEAQPSSGELTETTIFNLTVDNGGCEAMMHSVTVNVINEPDLIFDGETTVCEGLSVTFGADAQIPGGTYNWIGGGETFNTPTVTTVPVSSTIYTLTYNSPANFNGEICYSDNIGTIDIGVVNTFLIENCIIEPDPVFEGDEINFSINIDPNGEERDPLTYDWFIDGSKIDAPNEGILMTTAPQVEMDSVDFIYSVNIVDQFGCMRSCMDTIFVINSLAEMPNAFTPNGDSTNDVFRLVQSPNVDVTDFRIYDRWGKEVYQLSDNPEGWDGTLNDKAMPGDVYFYVIEYDFAGNIEIVKGDVTLIR